MKKILILLVLILSLLGGCKSKELLEEDATVLEESATLMELAEEIDGVENVVYIPNEHVSNSWYPNIYDLGDNLLIVSYPEYYEGDEFENQETQKMQMKLLSMKNGELLKEIEVPYVMGEVQICGSHVVICEPQSGSISVYDHTLKREIEYEIEADPMESWYMTENMDGLYISDWDEGFFYFDLLKGKRKPLVEQGVNTYVSKDANGNLFCHYTDLVSQKNATVCYNMKTGGAEQVPLEFDIGYDCSKYEDSWLILSATGLNKYYFCEGENRKEIPYEGNGLQLINDNILLVREKAAMLYGLDGEYLSGFELPKEYMSFINNQMVWSEFWQGYFMIENNDEGSRLLFWDLEKSTEGEALQFEEPETRLGNMVAQELYERANQISDRYGVNIHIADLCEESYAEYTCAYETDEEDIVFALDMLEEYMDDYPIGFFNQLTYGDEGPLNIEIVTELQRDDGIAPSAAFVWGHIMVFDSWSLTESNFYHEVSHVIDQKLAFNTTLYDDALYSEETWLSMQPEGFDYAYSYVDQYLLEVDYDYFVSSYSATFPTEDRAELLDYAMRDVVEFEKGGALYEKLEYYSQCIRECFDTVGWPAITMWEEPLYQ